MRRMGVFHAKLYLTTQSSTRCGFLSQCRDRTVRCADRSDAVEIPSMAQRSVIEKNEWLKLSDEELLTQYYLDNDDAFVEFAQRYRTPLKSWAIGRLSRRYAARRELAEDLAGNALSRVIETKVQRPHARWNPDRGAVKPWLSRILNNQVNSFLRTRRGKEFLDTDSQRDSQNQPCLGILAITATTATAEPALERLELHQLLRQAIDRLPSEQQRTIQLTFWDGLTLAQIGTELGVSTATAYRLLKSAKAQLEGFLGRHMLSA